MNTVRRQQKQDEAKARQAEYDKLTLQEKLDRLPKTGAKRQRERFGSAILAESPVFTEPSEPGEKPRLASKSSKSRTDRR